MSILPSLLNTPAPQPLIDGRSLAADPLESGPVVLPLHALLQRMDGAIRAITAEIDPAGVWINAEVAKLNTRNAGGVWFAELADPVSGKNHSACLSVRISPQLIEKVSLLAGITVTPDLIDGQAMTMRIGLRLHPRHGFSAQALEIDPAMTPSLRAAAQEKLRRELSACGLYDLQRALPTPGDIVHLAVICPDGSAARGDVEAVPVPLVERRLLMLDWHKIKFEGPAAAGSLVTVLEGIARQNWRPRADATLIVRGGGSAAAIATIETRVVAEAIARMPMPVVLGIGHAADRGILAEIAWQACSTPTSAATAVRDLIVGAAMAARNHACSIAALCRQRIAAQEMACRTAANTIRRTTYRTLGEQTTQLASRDHDLDTVVARVDERLCGFDADIARMVGDLHAHADGATGVFSRHLKELDRTMQVIREQGAIQLLTAERDVARYAAEFAQARLSRAQLPVPHVFPAEDVPIIVKAPDGEIVTSAYRARDRPLMLQFHDGQIPVWPHPAATIQPVVGSSVTAS